ncbi:putative dimethyl sulfoxide reductase chaperone DmsD [Campylobacter blaseri]|uniref:Uncharacterized protein n=1 Tax=Campylobacter blaseri TaxID=2042961 RepID=A0A2P8R3C2_9BACT|nr:molecular chaperone TorD family protein [Campylobacter blaseri]PSM52979.1 hypothetical protein CQ405_00015 [Campylobacter blaseri]PSM54446.1 hypothetical protein CRN67_00015 [Campylobacter blaseri]QKF85310.1 putative dimethyl sulfoxide reductase chaperone DmsD [Campylobacter blaseri]
MLCTDKEIPAFISKLFMQVFAEPRKELFLKINDENLALSWFYENSDLNLKQGLEYLQLAKKEKFEDIEVDFTRLFLCDDYFLKAPPYASYYYSIFGDMISENSTKVEKHFLNSEFKKPFDALPSDSVANEFAFLAFCFENQKIDELKIFLKDEMLPYIFYFLNNIKTHSNTNFYRGFALLTENFMQIVQKELNIKKQKRAIHHKNTGN